VPFRAAVAVLSLSLVSLTGTVPAFGRTTTTSSTLSREVALAALASTVSHVQPSLQKVMLDPPGAHTSSTMLPKYCNPRYHPQIISKPIPCTFGDKTSSKVIVLVGSSHAGMWLRAAIDVAVRERVALKAFIYTSCVPIIASPGQNAFRPTDPRVTATTCATWNSTVGSAITALKPAAVFVGSGTEIPTTDRAHAQWVRGMTAFLATIHVNQKFIIGATPHITTPVDAAQCLLSHATNIEPCVTTVALSNPRDLTTSMLNADEEISAASGATLVDVVDMLCTSPTRATRVMRCPPVIDGRLVYVNGSHLTTTFTTHIEGFLQPIFEEIVGNA